MKRLLVLAALLATLALFVGCAGGPAGANNAEALANWLDAQSYSGWRTFRHEGEQPPLPASPDGLTLGSPNIFAAIGCNPDDLGSLDVFWADRRTVRPLAKPLTVSVRTRGRRLSTRPGGRLEPLADFPDQTLRRIRHTAIAVSASQRPDLSLTCVDFASLNPEHNFLVRWFLLENTGDAGRSCDLVFETMAPGEWRRRGDHDWRCGDSLAFVSDAKLRLREGKLQVRMGFLRPGDRAAAAVLMVGCAEPGDMENAVASAEAALADLPGLLEETKRQWESWSAKPPIETGDERTDDLLDSLLCLVLSHVGPEAIHTGSVRYRHDRAWTRDSYWVQRALLELGRVEEAKRNLEFFHRAWQTAGIASYYGIPDAGGAGYGYHRVELPHYLVLMVRDAERLGGADGGGYWDMVSSCLDEAAVPPNGLQPMTGDETWLLATPVRELDSLLNSSWLLVASAEYGAELAARVGDSERAGRYRAMASRARMALQKFLPTAGQAEWLASGRGSDGSLDFSLAPGILARGAILDVLPSSDQHLAAGLITAWHRLSFPRGIRTHSRSATISGGTPGYVLYAAADSDTCAFTRELAARVLDFCSATGCVWEFHDLRDPAWGGEKRRLWDSAVLLMGLLHALCDVQRGDGSIRCVPSGPPIAPPQPPTPPFDAGRLLAEAAPALILHDRSSQHAARIARELLRHRNRVFAVGAYRGEPPSESAIIVSPSYPPGGWRETPRGYWVRRWEGPPQLWVRNRGHAWLDTDGLMVDLLSLLEPEREAPLPFPDANFDLAARLGQTPEGEAKLAAVSLSRRAEGRLRLEGGESTLAVGDIAVSAKAAFDPSKRLLKLSVSAPAPRPNPVELAVTLPAGWWVVYARDMTGRWDRVRDPVAQLRLADGRVRLVYSFHAGHEPVHLSFDLARLPVGEP
jgi:hypothetical protein